MRHIIAALAAALVVGCAEREPEPEFEGRPAAEWIADLEDRSPETRRKAVAALSELGESEQARAALVTALGDADPQVASAALEALRRAGLEVLPMLTQALASENAQTRANAALLLGELGPEAQPAVAELGRLAAEDPQWDVRFRAVEALGRMGPAAADAEAQLRDAAQDEDPNVRAAAEAVLAQLGGEPAAAEPAAAEPTS